MKTSSDVVGAVMKELKLQSGQPGSDFRLAVAVDGVNALWGRSTIKKEDKSAVRKRTTIISCLTLVVMAVSLLKVFCVPFSCTPLGGSRGTHSGL